MARSYRLFSFSIIRVASGKWYFFFQSHAHFFPIQLPSKILHIRWINKARIYSLSPFFASLPALPYSIWIMASWSAYRFGMMTMRCSLFLRTFHSFTWLTQWNTCLKTMKYILTSFGYSLVFSVIHSASATMYHVPQHLLRPACSIFVGLWSLLEDPKHHLFAWKINNTYDVVLLQRDLNFKNNTALISYAIFPFYSIRHDFLILVYWYPSS